MQEQPYEAPGHEFKQVPSSQPNDSAPSLIPDDTAIRGAADIINAGEKVAILIGQGARTAAAQVGRVADITGAGVAKALLGKDVLSDELPYVTGSIGLLGTRPSDELMRDCDTLLIVGSNFPYSQFLPEYDAARAVQIDIDGSAIGMRYRTVTPRSVSSCKVLTMLRMLRPGRSSRQTMRVSPLPQIAHALGKSRSVIPSTGHHVVENLARPGSGERLGLLLQSLADGRDAGVPITVEV